MGPSTPRGWLKWAVYTLDAQSRPFSVRYDGVPGTDRRLNDAKETALSVKIMLERASAACTRNGLGVELLFDLHVREASWYSFTVPERRIIRKVERDFRRRLQQAGFLPGEG